MALSPDGAVALQDELIEAYGAAEVQRRLRDLNAKAVVRKAFDSASERELYLLELQRPIVARHGFEGSAKGVGDAMVAFIPEEISKNSRVIKRNHQMESLLRADAQLRDRWGIAQQTSLRDVGYWRSPPCQRHPLVEREENRLIENCVVARVPRAGLLSAADTEALVVACRGGDVATASRLLGSRQLGAGGRAALANVGYRALGAAGAKTLGRALGGDLESLELDVSGNNIGAAGAQALAAGLPRGLRLLKLNVSNNRITPSGLRALAASLPAALEVLHLGLAGVQMGPEGARALAEGLPPRLQDLSLDLHGNALTDEGVLLISRALPKTLTSLSVVLLKNGISRRGMFCIDRQIGDPSADFHLPLLKPECFSKVADIELHEFKEEEEGTLTRQLDFRSNF
mmetsp:Transcript_45564/g.146228  ORF Transcript_45564/g.146228 Transcript_45564/m.146228 type:complete len:401 (+) Transcript_45564:67-1269(+)